MKKTVRDELENVRGEEGVYSNIFLSNDLGGWFRMDRVVSKHRGGSISISGQNHGQRRGRDSETN